MKRAIIILCLLASTAYADQLNAFALGAATNAAFYSILSIDKNNTSKLERWGMSTGLTMITAYAFQAQYNSIKDKDVGSAMFGSSAFFLLGYCLDF